MSDPVKLLKVRCPGCRLVIWVDPATETVIRTEAPAKEKTSLDDLLLQEKQKKSAAEERFLSTVRLRDRKQEEARKRFSEVLSGVDREEDED